MATTSTAAQSLDHFFSSSAARVDRWRELNAKAQAWAAEDAQRQAWRWTRRDGSGARGSARAGRFLCLSRRTLMKTLAERISSDDALGGWPTGATHQRRVVVG